MSRSPSGYRFALQPRWLGLHLLLVGTVLAFLRLGDWQLDSFGDQRTRPVTVGVDAAAPLETAYDGTRLLAADRVVSVRGRYDAAGQVVVRREQDGQAGEQVLTALVLADGRVLPVLRGWTPSGRSVPPEAGTVELVGVTQQDEVDAGSRPEGRTAAGAEVSGFSSPELLRRLPYPPDRVLEGFLLLVEQRPPATLAVVPPAGTGGGVGAWRNLAYGLQWWFFAAAAVWLWAVSLRGRARDGLAREAQEPTVRD